MKVIQILPELNAGGVERGTLEVGKYLTEQGHESIVISNGGRLVAQLEAEGSRHIPLPVHKKRLSSLKQVKVLRRLFETGAARTSSTSAPAYQPGSPISHGARWTR
jgi:hypothetical protein